MSKQPGSVSSAVKNSVMIVLMIVVIGMLLVFFLSKSGAKRTKIITQGDSAPEFALPAVDGRQVNLSALRGKAVMVHFWATWCPPCVEEIPTLERLYRQTLGKDLEILAISVDEGGATAVQSFLSANRLTLPVLLDSDQSVSRLYGTFKFPETYILDRNGIVRHKAIGARDWTMPENIAILRDAIVAQ